MKIKILITYKEKHKVLNSDVLMPIQTGRALASEVFEDMIGDDTGVNISKENFKYSELSAQYWAWKNYSKLGNPDYIGHMQYRRHFIFNENAKFSIATPENQKKGFSVKFVPYIDDNYIENIGLTKEKIESEINGKDIIAVKKADMTFINCKNAKDDYLKHVPGSQSTDYDLLMAKVVEKYPEYKFVVDKFEKEPFRYFYHMFIMRKNIFFEYNKFIFSILFDMDKLVDFSRRGSRGGRVLGYLGEFLLSLFIMKKEIEGLHIKELYSTCVLNNDVPHLKSNILNIKKSAISIVLNKNTFYNGIVSLLSMDKYLNTKIIQNVVILWSGLDAIQLKFLQEWKLRKFKIILLNLNDSSNIPDKYKQCEFLQLYYILSRVDKIVYVSPQCVFNSYINLDMYLKNSIWVAKHPEASYLVNHNMAFAAHVNNILNIENAYDYFSDKFIIVNNSDYVHSVIEKHLSRKFFTIKTQSDILNYMFKNCVNYFSDNFLAECSAIERKKYFTDDEYLNTIRQSKLLYCTNTYSLINRWFYSKFWRYLSMTPFYEVVIFSLLQNRGNNQTSEIIKLREEFNKIHFPNINNQFKLIYIMNHLNMFKLKKIYYKLCKIFAFGKRYVKYNDKYQKTKQLIKGAKKLRRFYERVQ